MTNPDNPWCWNGHYEPDSAPTCIDELLTAKEERNRKRSRDNAATKPTIKNVASAHDAVTK